MKGAGSPSLEVDAEGKNSPDILTVRDRIDIEGPENVRVVYERLRVRLESGVEDNGIRMLFVGVRRSLGRIAADIGLMAEVARRLRSLDGWEGRARLPGRLGMLAREIEEKARLYGRRS